MSNNKITKKIFFRCRCKIQNFVKKKNCQLKKKKIFLFILFLYFHTTRIQLPVLVSLISYQYILNVCFCNIDKKKKRKN